MLPYPTYQALFHPTTPYPAIRVLRARQAPLILCFLHQSFKAEAYAPVISGVRLTGLLIDFLETWELGDEDGDATTLGQPVEAKAARLIKEWVEHRYLTLYSDEHGDDQHTLTPELETALQWVAGMLEKPTFVGTESRFLDIMQKLRELVQNTDDDWLKRVAALEAERARLDEQILMLRETRAVPTYDDYQVEERFATVSGVARSLLSDFRKVEVNFREITQQLYKQQTEHFHSRGDLVRAALDALDALRQTAQGRSFEAFYQLLLDPRQRIELEELVTRVFGLLAERGLPVHDPFLRKLRFYLHQEGRKVSDAFYQLAQKLEKLITDKGLRERRRSLLLINEIRRLALDVLAEPPAADDAVGLVLEGSATLNKTEAYVSLTERETGIAPRSLAVAALSAEDADEQLVRRPVLDITVLQERIHQLLREKPQVTLREVVDRFGLRFGVAELLAYGGLAASTAKHVINDARTAPFVLDGERICDFPEVIFCA